MNVLVAYASKHGSTREIAERVGAVIRAAGLEADVRPASRDLGPEQYDAFVVGASAYYGRWLRPAVRFVRTNEHLLASRPTWLFTSGPLEPRVGASGGDPWTDTAVPRNLRALAETLNPRDTTAFTGSLDPARLTFFERGLRRLPTGRGLLREGDFRDWQAIDAWAGSIAASIGAVRTGE